VKRSTNWLVIIGAIIALTAVAAISVRNWNAIGGGAIDLNGWIALVLGVLATLAVGVGLMALVFISNRRGYDEPPGKDAGKDG
jgi:hypothetical protein